MAFNVNNNIVSYKVSSKNDNSDSKKEGVVVVDPNKVYTESGEIIERYIPQEELVMFVDLKARLNPRNRILEDGDKKTLVDVASFKSYKAMNPKNKDGTDKGFLTTDWTEMFEQDDVRTDTEGLGIENIDIRINASLTPQIDIVFIDTRGQNLLIKGDEPDSPYNLFYSFPYPLFILTFKGYYGNAVSYPLVLEKVNTEFDSSTGDFKIKCTFHSYTFALLNDFNIVYGHIVSYMYPTKTINDEISYEGLSELKKIYNNQEKYYSGENFINKPFTIYELITSLNNLGKKLDLSSLISNAKKTKENISNLYSQIERFKNIIEEDSNGIIDANDLKNTIDTHVENISSNELFNDIKGTYSNNFVTVNTFIGNNGFTLDNFLKIINQLKVNLEEHNNKIILETEKELTTYITEHLGFKPTVKNVIRIFLNNLQAFVSLLSIKAFEAYDQCSNPQNPVYADRTNIQIKFGDSTTVPVTGTTNSKNRIFPFPNYYSKRNDEWEKIFPGVNGFNSEWEEVKFVKEFYKAQLNMGNLPEEEEFIVDEYNDRYTDTSTNGILQELMGQMCRTIFSNEDFYSNSKISTSFETKMKEAGEEEAQTLLTVYFKNGTSRRSDLIAFHNDVFKDSKVGGIDNLRNYIFNRLSSDELNTLKNGVLNNSIDNNIYKKVQFYNKFDILQNTGMNQLLNGKGTNRFGEKNTLTIPDENAGDFYCDMKEDFSTFEKGKILWRDNVVFNKNNEGKRNKLFNSIYQDLFLINKHHQTKNNSSRDLRFFKKMILGNQSFNHYGIIKYSDEDYNSFMTKYLFHPSIYNSKFKDYQQKQKILYKEFIYGLQYFFFILDIELNSENIVLLNGWIRYFLNLIYKEINQRNFIIPNNNNEISSKVFFDQFLIEFKNLFVNMEKAAIPYLNGFAQTIKKSFNQVFAKTKQKETGKVDALSNIDDLRTNTYYNIKTFFDNWISFEKNKIDGTAPLFFNFYNLKETGNNNEVIEIKRNPNNKQKDLIDYFSFIDRGNRDIGNDVLIDINWLINFFGKDMLSTDVKNLNISYYSFFSELGKHHGFLLHALPTFTNFDRTIITGETAIDFADVFGVFDYIEQISTNPAFIFQYVGDTTSLLNTPATINEHNKTKSFELDYREGQLIKADEIPNDLKEGFASVFIINYGNQEQQIFSDVAIDQAEYQNTEEAIDVMIRVAQGSVEAPSANLFQIYTQRSYTAQVTSMGNAMIQPLMFFYLKGIPLFYGTYWITHVSHNITANNIKTEFKGVRQPISVVKPKSMVMLSIVESFLKTVGIETDYTKPIADSGGFITLNANDLDRKLGSGSKFSWRDLLLTRSPKTADYNKSSVTIDSNTYKALNSLYLNVIKHIEKEFPKINIVSALRRNDINGSTSNIKLQHFYGEAVDLQYPDLTGKDITDRTQNKKVFYWATKNLPAYDQIIWETDSWTSSDKPSDGTPRVIHISLNTTNHFTNKQRYERKAIDGYGHGKNKLYYHMESTGEGVWKSAIPKQYAKTKLQESYSDVDYYSKYTPSHFDKFGEIEYVYPNNLDFFAQLTSKIGVPETTERLRFFYAWNQAEGNTDVKKNAAFNPFNTTFDLSDDNGQTIFNKHTVKNYSTVDFGVDATYKTLILNRYSNLYDAIKRGESAMEMAENLQSTSWGTGGLVIDILEKSSTIKGQPLALETYQVYTA